VRRSNIALALLLAVPDAASAACCVLAKIDGEFVPASVRVCTDGGGACASVLYEGPLPLGTAREVCTEGTTVVYQEWDASLAGLGPVTTAVCDGGAVEL
jgi:hypothetical protein